MTVAEAEPIESEDILRRLEQDSTLEYVRGHFKEKNVSAESSETEVIVGSELLRATRKAGHRVFSSSLIYRCFPNDPTRMRRPDASVVKGERLQSLADPLPRIMPIAPDLAVEVISPNDNAEELSLKLADYRAAGVPLIWVLHPATRSVDVYRDDGTAAWLLADDTLDAADLLPGWTCRVADLFGAQATR